MKTEIKEKKEYSTIQYVLFGLLAVFIGLPIVFVLLIFIVCLMPFITIYLCFREFFISRNERLDLKQKHLFETNRLEKNFILKSKPKYENA